MMRPFCQFDRHTTDGFPNEGCSVVELWSQCDSSPMWAALMRAGRVRKLEYGGGESSSYSRESDLAGAERVMVRV